VVEHTGEAFGGGGACLTAFEARCLSAKPQAKRPQQAALSIAVCPQFHRMGR